MTDILDSLPIIFFILIVVFFIITIVLVARRYAAMKRLLETQALKRGGTLERSINTWLFKFQYHDCPVTVSAYPGSRYSPPETKVLITLPKPAVSTVSISHESVSSRIGKAFGGQDIQIGMDAFDNAYRIKAEDEYYVRIIINLTVQNKLLELEHERPHILLKGPTLNVSVSKLFKTDEQYDKLIDLATTVIDQLEGFT